MFPRGPLSLQTMQGTAAVAKVFLKAGSGRNLPTVYRETGAREQEVEATGHTERVGTSEPPLDFTATGAKYAKGRQI